jgi:hypothetical protein
VKCSTACQSLRATEELALSKVEGEAEEERSNLPALQKRLLRPLKILRFYPLTSFDSVV